MNQVAFFTIITATYNAGATLERLLQSLAEQSCKDFVWVCQDAQSSDNTLDIVERWRTRLPAISLASEKDTGIYDAWNKALAHQGESLGQWVLFLGGDDLLAGPNVLERVKTCCESLPSEVVLAAGGLQQFSEGDEGDVLQFQSDQSFASLAFGMIPHSALFAHYSLLRAYPFNSKYSIAGDYDWLRRVWRRQEQMYALDFMITKMAAGGISSSTHSASLLRSEKRMIILRYLFVFPSKAHQALFYCVDSLLFPVKLHFKQWINKSSVGRSLWCRLQKVKRALLK